MKTTLCTARDVAPPEQFRSPMLVWASDKLLSQPQNTQLFEQLKAQQRVGTTHRHEALFDSILGCLVYRSTDGGINVSNNGCALPSR